MAPLKILDRKPAGFPGEIAGASLKRAASMRLETARGGFPGEIAGASLKRSETGFNPLTPITIPRRNRRGLIEAGGEGEVAAPDPEIPRRNRRGLIEAGSTVAGAGAGAWDSPAKSPGPH